MTLISYVITLCRARPLPGVLPSHAHHRETDQSLPVPSVGPGLDEAALRAFPKLLYSKANIISTFKLYGTNNIGGNSIDANYSTSLSCSVCLADYDESDVLRVLPDCGHVFHLKCVDSWLRIHPTCPVCRKLPSAPTSPESCQISVQV